MKMRVLLGLIVPLLGCSSAPGVVPPIASAKLDLAPPAGSPPDGKDTADLVALAPETFADYLIQDVCATDDGRLLDNDPYDGCPSSTT